MKIILILFSIIFILTGCITTHVKRENSMNYAVNQSKSHAIEKIVVSANINSLYLSNRLEVLATEAFSNLGIKALLFRDIFPPRRDHSAKEITKKLKAMGIDSHLVFFTADSDAVTHFVEAPTGQYVMFADRSTLSKVKLFNVESGEIVWMANARTDAGGTLNMTDQSTLKNLSQSIVKSLQEDGYLSLMTSTE